MNNRPNINKPGDFEKYKKAFDESFGKITPNEFIQKMENLGYVFEKISSKESEVHASVSAEELLKVNKATPYIIAWKGDGGKVIIKSMHDYSDRINSSLISRIKELEKENKNQMNLRLMRIDEIKELQSKVEAYEKALELALCRFDDAKLVTSANYIRSVLETNTK